MDYALNNKRRVVRLVLQWATTYGDLLQEDDVAMAFLEVRGVLPSRSASSSYNTHAAPRHGSFPGEAVIANSRLCQHVHLSEMLVYFKRSKEKHHPLSYHSNSVTGSILTYFHLVSFSLYIFHSYNHIVSIVLQAAFPI